MRPVDLAREHGLSTQAVRNYEQTGILPTAARSDTGYRRYTPAHAQALRTFLALVPGHGHATATAIMVAVNHGETAEALRRVDVSHAGLLADRDTLDAVERALRDLTTGRVPRPTMPIPVGALAHRLHLRPATLRRWERLGLLTPTRDAAGYRVYSTDDVRDAHIIGQLRRSGHGLEQIAPLLADVRDAGSTAAVGAALAGRRTRLDGQARAMLAGAAQLDTYLRWEHA